MKRLRFLMTALLLVVSVGFALAQNIQVKGTVTDASTGEAVPFAFVQVKGTTNGTSTDALGNYTLRAPGDAVLVFSYMGYQNQEVSINSRAVVNVALSPDVSKLEDVIVVAFGTSTKESFTGSATVVNENTINKAQVTSVTNALAGAVPGVQLTSSNGAPGATSTMRIRGFSSISAGQDPLIIIDGAPYSGDLANISQTDVESITVLKDAASNALYGARGANGVIMITTKKAKRGEAQVTLDAKFGFNERALQRYNTIQDPKLYYETHFGALESYYQNVQGLSTDDALLKANANIAEASTNGGLGYLVYTVPQNQLFIGSNGKVNPNATLGAVVGDYYITPDDWEAAAYKIGARQEYTLTVAGANDKASFYSSLSYLDNQGITYNSGLKRITARLKADYQAKSWMKVGANMAFTNYNSNYLTDNGSSTSTGNVWVYTSQMAPIYPLYIRNADGSKVIDANGVERMDYGDGLNAGLTRPFMYNSNALQDLQLNTHNSNGNAANGTGFIDIDIFKGLKFTINGTYSLDEDRFTEVLNPYYGQFASTKGTVGKEHDRSFDLNTQQLLNYNKTCGKNTFSVLLGHEYTDNLGYSLYASKSNMFSQKNKELSGAVVDGQSASSSKSEYNNEGYFSRAQYDYDSRIFLSASYRRDASSRFSPAHRWGNFWSAGASWLLNKETWFSVPWVNELKLKASIGSQGNDNIGSYRYTDLYTIANSSGNVSTMFSSKGSENITWETNTNFNSGLEFTIFQKLSGSIEFFNRKTTDMLFSFPVAPSMGYSSYMANVGDMKNYGGELDLNFNILNTKNLRWDVNFNATILKNKITMLDAEKKTKKAYDADGKMYEGYQSGDFFVGEGLSLYSWYLREYAGVNENGESTWYKDVLDNDGNRTGERTTTTTYSDATYYINNVTSIPDLYGGFGTALSAFGFDFSINCSYQLGGKQYDSGYASAMASPTNSSTGYAFHADVLKSWTKTNTSSNIPRFQLGDVYSAGTSTRFLTNASYLNIENINLGYTLPENLTKNIKVSSIRFYVSCENVWYWSMRQGFDPRMSYTGTNQSSYSPMRTLSGGITLKF